MLRISDEARTKSEHFKRGTKFTGSRDSWRSSPATHLYPANPVQYGRSALAGSLEPFAELIDRPRDLILELHFRLPAKDFFRCMKADISDVVAEESDLGSGQNEQDLFDLGGGTGRAANSQAKFFPFFEFC